MVFGEDFRSLNHQVPFKLSFIMTQPVSSKKHRTSQNNQSCFCAKARQAIVCGSRLPGSVKQANKGSPDLATSDLQEARPAVCVPKRNISVSKAFGSAEERKRVPPGRAITLSKPAVKSSMAGIKPALLFLLPLSLWGQGWPLLAAHTMGIQIQWC